MGIRIIDNKKIDLTEYEFNTYQKLCKSYDRPNFKGSELFVGLFESDGAGMITHLNPPGSRYTSMEVVCFLQNVFVNQRMAQIEQTAYQIIEDLKKENQKLTEALTAKVNDATLNA